MQDSVTGCAISCNSVAVRPGNALAVAGRDRRIAIRSVPVQIRQNEANGKNSISSNNSDRPGARGAGRVAAFERGQPADNHPVTWLPAFGKVHARAKDESPADHVQADQQQTKSALRNVCRANRPNCPVC